jgi:cysteinyl-tRNA synthetase
LTLSKGHPTEEILSLLKRGLQCFSEMGSVFGLFREDHEAFLTERKKAGLRKLNFTETEILAFIDERNSARKGKDWKRADAIRDELLSKGILLEDSPSGTTWKLK